MFFNLNDFSKYRSALMGVSILIIMLFHCAILPNGHIGVEFFLSISAIGLYYSLKHISDIQSFYKRRLWRILPAYILLTIPYLAIFKHLNPEVTGVELLESFFQIRALTQTHLWSQWFISLILICYLITPLFFKNRKVLLSIPSLILLTLVCFFGSRPFAASYIIERIPIFLWSLRFAMYVYDSVKVRLWTFLIPVLLLVLFSHYIDPLLTTRQIGYDFKIFSFLFLTIPLLALFVLLIRILPAPFITILNFFGRISLELYLSHECVVRLFFVYFPPINHAVSYIVVFSITLSVLLSYAVHQFVSAMMHKLDIR